MKSKDRIKREESDHKETVKTLRADLRKLQKEIKKYREDSDFLKIFKRVEKLEEENLTLKKKLKNLGKVLKQKSPGKTDEEIESSTDELCSEKGCGGNIKIVNAGKFSVRICESCKKREKI